jgi:hypothetical protein
VNVKLSPELEQRVAEYVAQHGAEHLDSLVENAVAEYLDEIDCAGGLENLHAMLAEAEAQLDRGEGIEVNDDNVAEFFRDIRERGLKRLAELKRTGTEG